MALVHETALHANLANGIVAPVQASLRLFDALAHREHLKAQRQKAFEILNVIFVPSGRFSDSISKKCDELNHGCYRVKTVFP
jgi:hypothetical protein